MVIEFAGTIKSGLSENSKFCGNNEPSFFVNVTTLQNWIFKTMEMQDQIASSTQPMDLEQRLDITCAAHNFKQTALNWLQYFFRIVE